MTIKTIPPLPLQKEHYSQHNLCMDGAIGTLATAHQRSYLLFVADSVNKWGPAWSDDSRPLTLKSPN